MAVSPQKGEWLKGMRKGWDENGMVFVLIGSIVAWLKLQAKVGQDAAWAEKARGKNDLF